MRANKLEITRDGTNRAGKCTLQYFYRNLDYEDNSGRVSCEFVSLRASSCIFVLRIGVSVTSHPSMCDNCFFM